MQQPRSYLCDVCDYRPVANFSDKMYVIDHHGNRIIYPHPYEHKKVLEVLGDDVSEDEIAQRTGLLSVCICTDCMAIFDLDLHRDPQVCPQCSSDQIASFAALRGRCCPKCHQGIIQEHLHTSWR